MAPNCQLSTETLYSFPHIILEVIFVKNIIQLVAALK